jgi:gluconate 2-dehydrogenase gamma chain
MQRRTVLKSIAGLTAISVAAKATPPLLDKNVLAQAALSDDALPPTFSGGQAFLTAQEKETIAAVFDRLIPGDELSIGAVEAGCVAFLDEQLGGDFGKAASQYRLGPFTDGTPEQGPQFRQTPAERYRSGIAALEAYCQQSSGGRFASLAPDKQDALLSSLETGALHLPDVDSEAFFALMLQNVREGFLADPVYGGNKEMASWKMIGFPGARYDFRDVVDKQGQELNIVPSSLLQR